MDFAALQQKLFDIDPTDRADDLRQLAASAGNPQQSVETEQNILQESVEVQEGTMPVEGDYSLSDFAKLAGVQLTEAKGDSFVRSLTRRVVGDDGVAAIDAGRKNYNKMDLLKKSADAALDSGKASKDGKAVPVTASGGEYKSLLQQHTVKLQKIAKNPQRKAQFDKFMAGISEEEELDEILPALAGIAGRAIAGAVASKAVDKLTANKNNKKKPIKRNPVASHAQTSGSGTHQDQHNKNKPDRKQKHKKPIQADESIKSRLWAALNSK
jgi:hypothetical protein